MIHSALRIFFVYISLCWLLPEATNALHHKFPSREATIAFHISVKQSNLAFLHSLLTHLYHPRNFYLIDYQLPLQPQQHEQKFHYQNVHHRAAAPFTENGVSEVINTLDGMAYFLDYEHNLDNNNTNAFDYYICTTPDYYPVLNPTHMRNLLSFPPHRYPPPNFMHFFHNSQLPLFTHEIKKVYVDLSLTFNDTLPFNTPLHRVKSRHPYFRSSTLNIPRASKRFVVNHEFVKMAVDSVPSKRLLLKLADTSHVDERFFATLIANSKKQIGKLVRTTSLQCINSIAMDLNVNNKSMPNYHPAPITIQFLENTREPCLFAGPFNNPTNWLFRQIDKRMHIPPGTHGKLKGRGYHDFVYDNLMAVTE